MATVHPLPLIEVHVDRRPTLDIVEEQLKEKLNDLYYKTCRLCEIHRVIIIITVASLSIGAIILSVMIKSGNISVNPCYYYTESTLASDVSVQCINYLWSSFQCSTALTTSPTWRWWIQSPQGLTMIKCDAVYKGILCGAGSFNNIKNYLSLCNPYFGQ